MRVWALRALSAWDGIGAGFPLGGGPWDDAVAESMDLRAQPLSQRPDRPQPSPTFDSEQSLATPLNHSTSTSPLRRSPVPPPPTSPILIPFFLLSLPSLVAVLPVVLDFCSSSSTLSYLSPQALPSSKCSLSFAAPDKG